MVADEDLDTVYTPSTLHNFYITLLVLCFLGTIYHLPSRVRNCRPLWEDIKQREKEMLLPSLAKPQFRWAAKLFLHEGTDKKK